jgi:hypothetical protein
MRRSTIGLLVTCACGLLWIPLMATAQLAEKVWRIGVLGAGVAPSAAERQQSSFWQAMWELGLVEGQNITVEILQAYQEQHSTVEPGFRWSKNPAAIGPVWLEKPEWIAALAMLTVVRLLLYAVIQRQVRLYLRDHQPQVPGNKGPTATPTAAVLLPSLPRSCWCNVSRIIRQASRAMASRAII